MTDCRIHECQILGRLVTYQDQQPFVEDGEGLTKGLMGLAMRVWAFPTYSSTTWLELLGRGELEIHAMCL